MITRINVNSVLNSSTEDYCIKIIPSFDLEIEKYSGDSLYINLSHDQNYQWVDDKRFSKDENNMMYKWIEDNIENILEKTLEIYSLSNLEEYEEEYELKLNETNNAIYGTDGKNVSLKEDYKQVCIWPGTTLGDSTTEDFEKHMLKKFGVRTQYLEEIETLPDKLSNGYNNPETGGRIDTFFGVHQEDISKFAMPRLMYGIRWIEDVLDKDNYHQKIYPERVFHYMSW
jgi:hypothetical protein